MLKNFMVFGVFFLMITPINQIFAQRFVEPADIKTNPTAYPAYQERIQVVNWCKNPDNRRTQIYSKSNFITFNPDQKATIEAYGYYIIYEGNYLRWSEIQTYENKKNQIVQRTYDQYKAYLVNNNIQHYFELFGN